MGREPYGDGALVVVAGVTSGRGGRESRPQGEGAQVIGHHRNREVCEMQSAETVLGVLRERGRRGLPLDELYRQLFNPQLYLLAYGRIYANRGAMTPGASAETVDGMSLGKIGRIIDALRHERYRFSPVKRTWIPKKNGKRRPLGLPTWSDKLVGEVMRLLLEAYYEPKFSARSHVGRRRPSTQHRGPPKPITKTSQQNFGWEVSFDRVERWDTRSDTLESVPPTKIRSCNSTHSPPRAASRSTRMSPPAPRRTAHSGRHAWTISALATL